MTVFKTPYKYWLERSFRGSKREHLCDTCVTDEGECDKSGAYKGWNVLGQKGWKVTGCTKYRPGEKEQRFGKGVK